MEQGSLEMRMESFKREKTKETHKMHFKKNETNMRLMKKKRKGR